MRLNPIVQALLTAAMSMPALSHPAAESLPLPPLLLAGVEQGQADVALYLVSEKIDGVRAFWDGQVLRTRSGNLVNAPRWFVENFPQHPLDGELWIGRGQFDRLSATVRRQVPNDGQWRQVRYLVFELPQAPGSFRERALALKATVTGHQPGRGKYAGMLGALRVRSADGAEFLLGTGLSEADRHNPPPIGTVITFRYRELNSRGIPRFASFHRLREE